MKSDKNKVAEAIAKKISKYPENTPADHGTLHHTLKMTKRESEAWLMASWFLINVEKMKLEDDKDGFNALRKELADKAIEITGK